MSLFEKRVISLRVTEEQYETFKRLAELATQATGVPATMTYAMVRCANMGIPRFMKELGIATSDVKRKKRRVR